MDEVLSTGDKEDDRKMKKSLKALVVKIYVSVALLLYSFMSYVYGLQTEERRAEVLCDYVGTTNFTYNALFKPSVYEIEIVNEGEILKLNLSMLESINVKYNYQFTCNRTGNITNTVDIHGILEEIDGWSAAIDGLVKGREGMKEVKTPTTSNVTAEFFTI